MSADIEAAARWLADQADPPRPVVVNLKLIFKLSPVEAVAAIHRANELRREAGQKVPRYRPHRRGRARKRPEGGD